MFLKSISKGSNGKNNRLQLQINTPPDLAIGSWHFKVITFYKGGKETMESICPVYGIYMLFNPWCEADPVYMEKEEDRNEYILNDSGVIMKGSVWNKEAIGWNYGQFEEGVLEACMLILEKSNLSIPLRSSPVYVCRMISQVLNSTHEGSGVMVSNWTNIFGSGTPPSIWTGSPPILREYATFGRSVRFAQCWVLAGVMNTVMRCLGIPSRVVTNYCSAHDMDNNSTITVHFNQAKGKVDRSYSADTIWTFHCWNDCWMSRPDLPKGYGGWQAIDCTPQNKSDEINAEKCYWVLDDRKQAKFLKSDFDQIGLKIVTKQPGFGENSFLDITDEYKDRKVSASYRKLTMNALLRSNSKTREELATKAKEREDISLSLNLKESCTLVGKDFTVGIVLSNRSSKEQTVKLYHRINAALYTGAIGRCVHSDSEECTVKGNETKLVTVRVPTREYLDKLLDQAVFVVSVFGLSKETEQMVAVTDSWCLKFPEITIKHEDLELNKTSKVYFSFINPLPIFLTKCRFVGEGSGILLPKIIPIKDVAPNCWVSASFDMKPWEGGERFQS